MLTIYKASAGSGKTYTLAYEYVKLLLGVKSEDGRYSLNSPKYQGSRGVGYKRHRAILAITFTNKATAEMKSRIVAELSAIASGHADGSPDSPYVAGLVREFGCTVEELRDVAARSLRSLLLDYHRFNVSTIDSFFQTVLRTFAWEVDRQGDYGIELNDEYAVSEGIGLMLDDLNYGDPPRRAEMMRWIGNYTMQLVEAGKDGSMFNRSGTLLKGLARYVRKMGSEVFRMRSVEVLDYLADPSRIKAFAAGLRKRIDSLSGSLRDPARSLLADFGAMGFDRRAMPKPVMRILDTAAAGEDQVIKDFGLVAVSKAMAWSESGDNSFYVKTYLPGGPKAKTYPPDPFTSRLSQLLDDCRRAAAGRHALTKILDACPGLEFLGFAWHYIDRFREDNNLILLSDTNELLRRIIGQSEAPFVYERLGVTLRHFLIDEFQDTSHMQWNNLRPLVADSLSTGSDNLIIGDEKQAIYRFRNSDSSLLHHSVAAVDFPDDHTVRGTGPADNTNHRSAPGIVRFNNALFTRMAAQLGVDGYENTVQSVSPRKEGLGAYITVTDTSGAAPVNDAPAELDLMAGEILRQHDDGYRWADIAVLVRRRKEAEQVVSYLLAHYPQISVLSDEALLLRNSPAVKMVVSMLKLVDRSFSRLADPTPADPAKPLYATMGDIRMMVSRYDYFLSEGLPPAQALSAALTPETGVSAGATILDSIIDIRSVHPSTLVSLVETIIAKKLPPARRRQEFAYLAAFQDEVIRYCSSMNPSVHAFLEWWGGASQHLAITSGSGQDAVAVMTIHKSKGLQWPCVHLPFGDWELCRPTDDVWIDTSILPFADPATAPPLISVEIDRNCALEGSPLREVALANRREQTADNLNATYVAYTRPERELHIWFSSFKATAAAVIEAIQTSGDDTPLTMDLRSQIPVLEDMPPGSPWLRFVSGSPTSPAVRAGKTAAPDSTLDDYTVCFRDDTSTLVSLVDATAGGGDITDGETAPEQDDASAATFPGDSRDEPDARTIAAERGIHLHAIMADITSPDVIADVVARAAVRYDLPPVTAASYAGVLAAAFDSAAANVARWFAGDADVYREQAIFVPEGDLTLRPDRIVVYPDRSADIIDYKFTSAPLPSHRRQVEQYVAVLRTMGFGSVRGYLWYPELKLIESV